jgi:hypothetical protein
MFGSRRDRESESVTCIACGETLPRSDAREYDKEGDRWTRHDKEFEYFCKDCYSDLCHQPREDLESVLLDVESATEDTVSSEDFALAYQEVAADRDGNPTDADRDADRDRDRDHRR